MTRSKEIVTELKPNDDQVTVAYGDNSKSKVLGLGKVVVAPDITLVIVLLVESLGFNLNLSSFFNLFGLFRSL